MLKHLKDQPNCPYCNAELASESWEGKDTEYQRSEHRRYSCGYAEHYDAFCGKASIATFCPREARERARTAKRSEFLISLGGFLVKADVDQDFYDAVYDALVSELPCVGGMSTVDSLLDEGMVKDTDE